MGVRSRGSPTPALAGRPSPRRGRVAPWGHRSAAGERPTGSSAHIRPCARSPCLTAKLSPLISFTMTIRPLVILPDNQLRLVSKPVAAVDDGVRRLADDMLETMYDAPGIGLAAIQIGVPTRVVTIDVSREEDGRKPQVFINPEVVWSSEETSTYEEGCLSIPDYFEDVERPAKVRVTYMTLQGEQAEVEAEGILATCLQHEIDHLNGVLFIDHISKLKRDRVVRKFTKLAKDKARGAA